MKNRKNYFDSYKESAKRTEKIKRKAEAIKEA